NFNFNFKKCRLSLGSYGYWREVDVEKTLQEVDLEKMMQKKLKMTLRRHCRRGRFCLSPKIFRDDVVIAARSISIDQSLLLTPLAYSLAILVAHPLRDHPLMCSWLYQAPLYFSFVEDLEKNDVAPQPSIMCASSQMNDIDNHTPTLTNLGYNHVPIDVVTARIKITHMECTQYTPTLLGLHRVVFTNNNNNDANLTPTTDPQRRTPFTYRVPADVNWGHPTVFRLNTSTWESAHACAVIAEQYSGIPNNSKAMASNGISSTFRDRTSEFRSLSNTLKKQHKSSAGDGDGSLDPSSLSTVSTTSSKSSSSFRSEFNKKASRIGLGVHETQKKISRLANFAKSFIANVVRLHGIPTSTIDEQTDVVNRTLEQYLRCFAGDQPRKWYEWIPWAEFSYNTSVHSSTKMSPFEAVYGIPPPNLLTYVPAVIDRRVIHKGKYRPKSEVLIKWKGVGVEDATWKNEWRFPGDGDGSLDPSSLSTVSTTSSKSSSSFRSEFNKKASRIGLGVHETQKKISRLANLAKKSTIFDDPLKEIQELTVLIKNDITSLNVAVSDLQTLQNMEIADGDYSEDRVVHGTAVCDDLKNKLMGTTKKFQDVLTARTENVKANENRRQIFSTNTARENPLRKQTKTVMEPPPWSSPSKSVGNAQPSESAGTGQVGNQLRRRVAADGTPSHNMEGSMLQQQVVPQQESYTQSRAVALQSVESTITELSGIFTNLATMVAHQGELAIS
nr:syntaxin-31 isoform X2 [Tanacetum cinerariifolium]